MIVVNDKRGHFVTTSVLGSATGQGGNFLVVDDPHDIAKSQSDTIREREVRAFHSKFYNRLDDKENGVIVIIMQRLHEKDLTGDLLSGEEKYEHLKIEGVCQESKTYIFPISHKQKEYSEGEVLHRDREDFQKLEAVRKGLGSYGFSGQYLQSPSPSDGGIFKKDYFDFYNKLTETFDFVFDSWDLSVKGDVESDFVVGIVWGIKGALKYILHRTKAKMGFGDSTKAIRKHRELYPKIERTVIEDKANGSPLIEILKKEVSGIIPYNPQVSKTERARLSEPDFEAKQVLLPVKDIATFDVDDFMHNLMAFPNAKNDDDVDATTCGIIYSKALFRKFNIY